MLTLQPLHSAQHWLPLLRFTCRCEIPMQLPILYSMSSSGEVTLALHGWQRTFLQNCILVGQTRHCQCSQICGATEQERACMCGSVTNERSRAALPIGAPVTYIFPVHCCIKIRLHKGYLQELKQVPPLSLMHSFASHLHKAVHREALEGTIPTGGEGGREAARRQAKMVPIPLKRKKDPGDGKDGVSSR